jgi:hypothetical protein
MQLPAPPNQYARFFDILQRPASHDYNGAQLGALPNRLALWRPILVAVQRLSYVPTRPFGAYGLKAPVVRRRLFDGSKYGGTLTLVCLY